MNDNNSDNKLIVPIEEDTSNPVQAPANNDYHSATDTEWSSAIWPDTESAS